MMKNFHLIVSLVSIVMFIDACTPVQPLVTSYSYDTRIEIIENDTNVLTKPTGLLVIDDSTCIVIQSKTAPNYVVDLHTGVIKGSIWPPDSLMQLIIDSASKIIEDSSYRYLSYADANKEVEFRDLPNRKDNIIPKYGLMERKNDSTIAVCCHSYVPAIRKRGDIYACMAPITSIVEISSRDFSIRKVTLLRPRSYAYTQFMYFRSAPNDEWWSSAWNLKDSLPPTTPLPMILRFTSTGRQTNDIVYMPIGTDLTEYYRPAPQIANYGTDKSFFLNDESGVISILDLKNLKIIPKPVITSEIRSLLRMDASTQFFTISSIDEHVKVVAVTNRSNPDSSRYMILGMKYDPAATRITLGHVITTDIGLRIVGLDHARTQRRVSEVRLVMKDDKWFLDRKESL